MREYQITKNDLNVSILIYLIKKSKYNRLLLLL